jgi:hypothetical protein
MERMRNWNIFSWIEGTRMVHVGCLFAGSFIWFRTKIRRKHSNEHPVSEWVTNSSRKWVTERLRPTACTEPHVLLLHSCPYMLPGKSVSCLAAIFFHCRFRFIILKNLRMNTVPVLLNNPEPLTYKCFPPCQLWLSFKAWQLNSWSRFVAVSKNYVIIH